DTSRIAGRIARVIRVTSTDEFRYGYRLWIDRESHMLLRSDLIAPDGEIVERLMFTRFSILESVGPEDFEPTHAEREYIEYGEPIPDLHALDDPEWQVTELPPGFHTVTHRSQSLPQGGNAVQQSVYSDGLASVSVFVQSLDEAPGDLFEGAAALGAVNAFVTRTDDREITVVGEVPPITVRRIARAVEQAEEQATAE
ncbi:MAG: MucB/RseB C-terminal domain-containing protein, partial [Halofilum sp. (in: g-proteobacteria)]